MLQSFGGNHRKWCIIHTDNIYCTLSDGELSLHNFKAYIFSLFSFLIFPVLKVSPSASKAEIKRAFRSIASKYHPDRFLDQDEKEAASQKFLKLQRA